MCPVSAISVGDPIYVISDECCDFEDCVVMCDDDAIVLIDTLEEIIE